MDRKYHDIIDEILSKYMHDDRGVFHNTIDELCSKGIGKGTYQDFTVLADLIQILDVCEKSL